MRRWDINPIRLIGICVFIVTIISSKGTFLPEKAEQESGCFGINGDVYIDSNCTDVNYVMAIDDVRYGAKALTDGCNSTDSNCCMSNSGDCSFRYRLDEQQAFCSGKKLCISPVRVSQNAIQNTTCDTSIFGKLTQFIYMDYYCIPRQRIFDVTNMTVGSVSSGMFAYLWNKNYGENNVNINVMQASDIYVSCSVQSNSCNSRIRVFSVHVKLDDPYTICGQNITFFYENGKTYSINCTPQSIGLLFESSTPYIRFEVHNSRFANGGRFWLGFQASESTSTIYLKCPGENQTCKPATTEESNKSILIIGIVLAVVLVILLIILAVIIRRKCKKTNKNIKITSQDDIIAALFAGSLTAQIYKSTPPRKTAMPGRYDREQDDYHIIPAISIFPHVTHGKNRLTPIVIESATNIQEEGQKHRKRKQKKKLKMKKKIKKNKVAPDQGTDTPDKNANL